MLSANKNIDFKPLERVIKYRTFEAVILMGYEWFPFRD